MLNGGFSINFIVISNINKNGFLRFVLGKIKHDPHVILNGKAP